MPRVADIDSEVRRQLFDVLTVFVRNGPRDTAAWGHLTLWPMLDVEDRTTWRRIRFSASINWPESQNKMLYVGVSIYNKSSCMDAVATVAKKAHTMIKLLMFCRKLGRNYDDYKHQVEAVQ